MANQFFVPFNNKPTDTFATVSGYTVPAGKYAKATFIMTCNKESGFSNSDRVQHFSHADTITEKFEFWVKAGTSLGFANPNYQAGDISGLESAVGPHKKVSMLSQQPQIDGNSITVWNPSEVLHFYISGAQNINWEIDIEIWSYLVIELYDDIA
jgi:hypothetical protein